MGVVHKDAGDRGVLSCAALVGEREPTEALKDALGVVVVTLEDVYEIQRALLLSTHLLLCLGRNDLGCECGCGCALGFWRSYGRGGLTGCLLG